MSKKGSEFHVKLDGIKFSAQVEKRIEAGIQSLVLSELAGYTPNPDDPNGGGPKGHISGGVVIVKPRPWPGLIAIKLAGPQLAGIDVKGLESKSGF